MTDATKLVEFMELVGRLKHVKRTGWILSKITEPETISGHMYRMAMLSFLVDNKENLDKVKIMQMTLIHDLAECIVGDITPHCGVCPEEKHKLEDEAMQKICELLGDKGPQVLTMFREYEHQQTPEAQYVKDLDRLDLIMQAFEYEKRDGTPGKLQEYFTATNGKINHPFVKRLAEEVNTQRDALANIPCNNKS
ncbi:5'-deoxynucleotidase HDDC2 [Neodiprion pinetum]|uniref:5'-deoxynucleotidase HDDC2 n=1 Tax=Neodiprion lecontei TaxID=441921 RepID=A0A6J0C7F1_NEOLC|nr:5'-deoxynucleotidase HDDC2 [Neodiprion lecontei]XP_046424543.1 5'-deoxynucleotidase HDDC2 [Neodiprion fabricii]XP_046475500.1 5'-deoxynucleotidase HDDC2 [Neodiprion pinetum]XP_046618230.1 5'-deoxynucleotidase HDDC2 [Neodiprion virginianus]